MSEMTMEQTVYQAAIELWRQLCWAWAENETARLWAPAIGRWSQRQGYNVRPRGGVSRCQHCRRQLA